MVWSKQSGLTSTFPTRRGEINRWKHCWWAWAAPARLWSGPMCSPTCLRMRKSNSRCREPCTTIPWAHHSIKWKACTGRLSSCCCIPMTIYCPAKNSLPLHFLTNITRSSKVSSMCTLRVQHLALQVMSGPKSRMAPLWATWQCQRTAVCFWSLCQHGSKDMTTNSLLGTSATSFATT